MRHILTATLVALSAPSAALADPAGFALLAVDAPHHAAPLGGGLWYPAAEGGDTTVIAENPVFRGITVRQGATVREGAHPVVVLSHGMGGNYRSLAWLGAGLAERGAVVAAIDHPKSTTFDFDLTTGMKHWTRTDDLKATLDALLADPRFAGGIDESRVMAAGFSYGGWTALSMAGVRGNHAGYLDHCRTHRTTSSHCDDLMRADVGLAQIDAGLWNAPHADARITHAVAIDPGLVWGIEPADVAGARGAIRLIALGEGDDRLLATNFDDSGFVDLMPGARVDRIAPAYHFSVLPPCPGESHMDLTV